MSKKFKAGALLTGGLIGAGIGHYYQQEEASAIVIGAIIGVILVNWIIGLVD